MKGVSLLPTWAGVSGALHGCAKDESEILAKDESEILAEDESPHSIHRAGEGSAIPVNYKSVVAVKMIEN